MWTLSSSNVKLTGHVDFWSISIFIFIFSTNWVDLYWRTDIRMNRSEGNGGTINRKARWGDSGSLHPNIEKKRRYVTCRPNYRKLRSHAHRSRFRVTESTTNTLGGFNFDRSRFHYGLCSQWKWSVRSEYSGWKCVERASNLVRKIIMIFLWISIMCVPHSATLTYKTFWMIFIAIHF